MAIVALEGIDKSGKGTQAELLFKRLRAAGHPVECIAFPDYETPVGKEIKRFLSGRVEFGPEVRQFLYVANRWERKRDIDMWLKEGKVVGLEGHLEEIRPEKGKEEKESLDIMKKYAERVDAALDACGRS
jgi:dTMP kinase